MKMPLVSFLLAMLTMLPIACASDSATPTPFPLSLTTTPTLAAPTATPSTATTTIAFWTVLPDKGINEKNLNDLIQAFQKEYPSISIKVSSAPSHTELFRKVVASIATGTLPDLVTGLDSDLAEYARLKALAPLDDYIADASNGLSSAELNDIPPAFAETMRLPGQDKIYALPFARGVLALYYHWTTMKAIGITNTPKDWNEFRLHAATITKLPKSATKGYAYRPDATLFNAMLQSRGGNLFDAEFKKATFNAAPGVEALQFLGDGLKEGWIYRVNGVDDLNDFVAGKTLYAIASTAAIPVVQDAAKRAGKDFEWGVAPLPQNTQKPALVSVGSNLALLKNVTTKQQAAWLFMRWLMRTPVTADWTQAAGVLPIRQSARSLLSDFYGKAPQHKQAIEELMPLARPEPNLRNSPDVREIIEGALATFESGKGAAKAVLDDAAAKTTVLLGEKR